MANAVEAIVGLEKSELPLSRWILSSVAMIQDDNKITFCGNRSGGHSPVWKVRLLAGCIRIVLNG
ncbi:hypothetical protein BaRGS_00021177, partial [Batillaria attramentaria]